MRELCVKIENGGFRWCHNQEDYQKELAKGAEPITFLQYLEGTKKEAEEEINDLLKIENCVGWYEAVDSTKEWAGFSSFNDLVSFVESEETAKYKQDTIDFAITNLDDLISKLQAYKEMMEEVSSRLGFIHSRIEDIEEEEKEGEEE